MELVLHTRELTGMRELYIMPSNPLHLLLAGHCWTRVIQCHQLWPGSDTVAAAAGATASAAAAAVSPRLHQDLCRADMAGLGSNHGVHRGRAAFLLRNKKLPAPLGMAVRPARAVLARSQGCRVCPAGSHVLGCLKLCNPQYYWIASAANSLAASQEGPCSRSHL